MFIAEQNAASRAQHEPQFTVIDAPSFTARPALDTTNSEIFILLNFAQRLVLIGGTNYAGEIKKSIFTVMNYLLPLRDVMPMHCSANIGPDGDVALFFGLSGTGKTTLSSDPTRRLIGDDEHGWSSDGVFNFEGGCYAKMIRLSAEAEPQIYATTKRFGTVLENVAFDPETRAIDLNDDTLTENTRGAYPLDFIDNAIPEGRGGHPKNVDHAHGGRVRRAAADRAAVAGRGDVSLPLGLHREGRRHRARRDGAEGDVQHLLRRAVHGVGSERLREAARRAHRETSGEGLAREHRLDRRPARRRLAHEDRAHARDDQRGALRPARPRAVPPRRGLQPRSAGNGARRAGGRAEPAADVEGSAAYDAQAKKLAAMFADNFKTFDATASADVKAAGPRSSQDSPEVGSQKFETGFVTADMMRLTF